MFNQIFPSFSAYMMSHFLEFLIIFVFIAIFVSATEPFLKPNILKKKFLNESKNKKTAS